jgi:hypothetical protein
MYYPYRDMLYSLYENTNEEGPRNVIVLSTAAGTRLNAIWKQKKERWYIVESGNEWNFSKIMDILTPRQFQVSVESGKYSLDY